MKRTLGIFCFILFLNFAYGALPAPMVITKYGAVVGSAQITQDGTVINEFMGIPFAQPPVGKLRWEKPATPIPWTSPLNTTAYKQGCIPCMSGQVESFGATEDCLYLNVWTPDLQGSLPVLFYIHGGAYTGGSAADFPPQSWREVWSRRGIVVVTIQYRLAELGFLTTNDSRIVANLGLWDQNMALRWVQDNIGRFGGNSKRVTIYGGSAGSSSVSQHTMSPYSKDLFQQAIAMSGSAMAEFARGTNTLDFSNLYFKKLKCDTAPDIKACMQSKTLDELYKVEAGYEGSCGPSSLDWLGFAPIIDGDFLPVQPEIAFKNAYNIPIIMGLNQKEGRVFTLEANYPFSVLPPGYSKYTPTSFANYIATWITSRNYATSENATAHTDIFSFYSQNTTGANDHYFWIEQYVRSYSDYIMNVPAVREALAKTAAGVPVFAFIFDHYNNQTWPVTFPCQGSTHSGDSPYVLDAGFSFTPTVEDVATANNIQELFVQFIHTGNPSTNHINWDKLVRTQLSVLD
ncbi:unnamed protein product, partial [Mesorhabditis belari]|uniref:Carboxylic ester hydrolase n=1 Tax=Mesorhabditis belari TaxID=2138241 RepID=A0AAF3EPH7_9BILA